jgi:cytoskeleton protein RodZ
MAESLGEKLRLAREARGITLSEVAAQTRIASRYLEAIEADNYKPLPGGVFNKGFIKAYAKYVGVDEQEALSDYTAIVATQSESDEDENRYRRPSVMTDDRNRSSWSSLIFAVIILALMSGGIYALVQWYRSAPAAPQAKITPPANPANLNTNSAINTSGQQISTDQIKVELRSIIPAGQVPPSITTAVDGGKAESGSLAPNTPRIVTPQTSVKISYSKYQAEKLQMTLNGKVIALPTQPLQPSDKEIVRFEINKDNLAQILQSGQIVPGSATANPPVSTSTDGPQPETGTATAAAPISTPKPATPKPTSVKTPPTTANTNATVVKTPTKPVVQPTIITTGTPKRPGE